MAEAFGTPPPPPPPKKSNAWLVALAVVFILCCCCVGTIGLLIAFGQDILNELGIYVLVPALTALF